MIDIVNTYAFIREPVYEVIKDIKLERIHELTLAEENNDAK